MNHMHLHCSDVSRSRRFYENYFGMEKAFDHEGGAVFLTDKSGFLLALFPQESGESLEMPDWFHFGICGQSVDHVKKLYARMQNEGVQFSQPIKEWEGGAIVFFCLDPDGYRVEVRCDGS